VRLSRPLPFEVIYALAESFILLCELVIDGSNEQTSFLVLPVMVFAFLAVAALDLDLQVLKILNHRLVAYRLSGTTFGIAPSHI
jgi:hypothetical protein